MEVSMEPGGVARPPGAATRRREGRPMFENHFEKMQSAPGFIAALDQSGGSTPGALKRYGIESWADETEMFDRVHEMRTRIMTSASFDGDRILGAILFEDTMRRQVEGQPTAQYLWKVKGVVPILKVDKGLREEESGARLMKDMPQLDDVLAEARDNKVFGTKMRSVVMTPGAGLKAAVDQQFDIGRHIFAAGLVPILEPEVDIKSPLKADAEQQLHDFLMEGLDSLPDDEWVMLKLTLPEVDDLYRDVVGHPRVLRVFALSGGYTRAESNERLGRQHGVVASFSRALTEGLMGSQTQEEFDALLDESIGSIYAASNT
ncbi:fructose bisphosphate aldolase [Tessaracoccus sp. MC1865]|nr:fructose bisphosphate aldolase [Tessaracoccus sp. MC1865]